MGKLKILQFIETGGPGGAEQTVLLLSQALIKAGHEVHVATLRTGWLTESLARFGIPYHQLLSSNRFDLLLPSRLAKILRAGKFDLIQSHLLDSNFYGALAAKLSGVRHIAVEHGDVHHSDRKRFLRLKLFFLRALKTKITAPSEYTVRQLAALGYPLGLTKIVLNPASYLPPEPSTRTAVRESLGVTGESEAHWLWIHTANFRPVKNQTLLIRAFAQSCRTSSIPQTLCLVGDGPMRGEFERLAAELQVSENVRFVGFCSDPSPYLQAGDGFVLSSLSESLPISLLEAMLAGLFIVSTNVGGISEVVAENQNAFLVPPKDESALAAAFGRVVGAAAWAKSQAGSYKIEAANKFTPETVAASFLKLFRESL